MKKLFSLLTFLITIIAFAQDNNLGTTNNLNDNLFNASSSIRSSYGASMRFINPKRKVEGSVHLFKNWNNYAIIKTTDKQKFILRNINLNLERNTFESKVGQDSIFSFNFNNIDKFVVNNMVFKNYYWNDDNRVYQIIFEDKNISILKSYTLKLIEGSANPMVNRKTDRYIQKERYYIREDNKIKQFKFTKKRILKLFGGDENKVLEVQKYAKGNKLSFKKENDVQKILKYSSTGKN